MCWLVASTGGQGPQTASAPGHVAPNQTRQTLWWYVMLLVLASAVTES